MIRANCRARFTAQDFDFIVRTLSRSKEDAVTLVDLLTDTGMRDSILDHELLANAIHSHNGHLSISSQFYFYILTRQVMKRAGIEDRRLCDYIASLLDAFSRTARLHSPHEEVDLRYISDLLLALQKATPAQTFFLRAHVGNYALFISGIFHENVQHCCERGAPDVTFYEEMGRASYRVVSGHAVARQCELSDIFENLSEQFGAVRRALNDLSDRLLNIGDDANIPRLQGSAPPLITFEG